MKKLIKASRSSVESKYETVEVNEKKETLNINWESLRKGLLKEINNGVDPLYEETEYGLRLLQICSEVEKDFGLLVEPSVQGGFGSIFIYDKNTEDLISEIDFDTYNAKILNKAINSYTENKFKSWYKSCLKALIITYSESKHYRNQ